MAQKKIGWKAIAIGQTVGILLGVGVLAAVKKRPESLETSDSDNSAPESNEAPLSVATVNDSLSFEHALEQAQTHVGEEGVFTWRGGVYASCDEQQWNEKPQEEKEQIVEQVDTEITIEELEENPDINMEDDGFIHVTDGHGHDYVYVNNERMEISSGDDISVVGSDISDDDIGIISTFAATENAHVIYTADDDVATVEEDENEVITDGEIVDLQTGEVYSQPVALIQEDDADLDVMLLEDDDEDLETDDIPVDFTQMEAAQMEMPEADMLTSDDGVLDDGMFDPGADDFHLLNGGY